jgi:hypothetical protein
VQTVLHGSGCRELPLESGEVGLDALVYSFLGSCLALGVHTLRRTGTHLCLVYCDV